MNQQELVMLETVDDNGFDLDRPAVLHYRIRAGEAEILVALQLYQKHFHLVTNFSGQVVLT